LKRLLPLWPVLLAGCSGLLLRPELVGRSAVEQPPSGIRMEDGRLRSSTGCSFAYRRYQSLQKAADDAWVILAHGFLRKQQRMHDLATAMAKEGLRVATLDFCNQKPWAGRHEQNSRDMRDLARHLGARRVVYAGFSAGALAALLAARADPDTVGVLTLDLVDADGLGVAAAKALHKPILALAGEPTNCNANGNGDTVYRVARQVQVRRIAGASHCDFESPTDSFCEFICTDPDQERDNGGRRHGPTIIADAVAAARALVEGDVDSWLPKSPTLAFSPTSG
jgi:pimeloyl-ACP methyl ester carboxylesterase